MSDKTIRELQSGLPWTAHYHRDFRSSSQTHKDFAHALLHIHKAGGKLATIIDEAEHGGYAWANPAKRAEVAKYVADMVICALRMATTCPDGQIDLQRAVEDRLTTKNNQLAEAAPILRQAERGKASGLLDESADYPEPGSWGRASEGWPEIDGDQSYAMFVFANCAPSIPYGSYVFMGQRGPLRVHADHINRLRNDFETAGYPSAEESIRRRGNAHKADRWW